MSENEEAWRAPNSNKKNRCENKNNQIDMI